MMSETASIDHYEVYETLYTRGLCKVKKARNTQTGRICALKLVRKSKSQSEAFFRSQAQGLQREFECQSQLIHDYILPATRLSLDSVFYNKRREACPAMYLEVDFCKYGTFFTVQAAAGKALEETLARTYFHQLIEAVSCCHQNRIIHWNIKSESLLLNEDFKLQLADFGSVEGFARKEATTPPEVLTSDVQSGTAVDIFCCGFLLFSWVFFESPFEKAEPTNPHYRQLIQDQPKFWVRQIKNLVISDHLKSLLASMLALDPTQRPTISEIKAHPWYNDTVLTTEECRSNLQNTLAKNDIRKSKLVVTKVNRFIVAANGYYRGLNEGSSGWSFTESDMLSSTSSVDQQMLPVPPYSSGMWKFSELFVTHSPDAIMNTLMDILKRQMYIEEAELKKGYKLKAVQVTDASKISFTCRLLDCGEGKYCVDFSLDSGACQDFYQLFTDFSKHFEKWITEA